MFCNMGARIHPLSSTYFDPVFKAVIVLLILLTSCSHKPWLLGYS